MILTKLDFLARAELDCQTLDVWIQEEWLIPRRSNDDLAFSEADLARARLIRDLIDDLGVNAEGVSVALHLLDQIHGLRSAMAEVLESIHQRSSPAAKTSGIENPGMDAQSRI
jgi:chaperone modulatory protein CbpM